MKILLLDNYDSFTYNLSQMCEQILGEKITVAKNDGISLEEIQDFDKIILSPGPGLPDEAGILKNVIRNFYKIKPILGVCLGLQAIVEVFGGEIFKLNEPFHGVCTKAFQKNDDIIFKNLPKILKVGRYHSWAANSENFPEELLVTSTDEVGVIMSFRHRIYNLHAVQYHPESILTPFGRDVLRNFLVEVN